VGGIAIFLSEQLPGCVVGVLLVAPQRVGDLHQAAALCVGILESMVVGSVSLSPVADQVIGILGRLVEWNSSPRWVRLRAS